MIEIAQAFGTSLDEDDYTAALKLVGADCLYKIGERTLKGPKEIVSSYEQNAIEGRKKMDELIWGKCQVTEETPGTYLIHFTDFLKHKGKSHIHRCKQRVQINAANQIQYIEHIEDAIESKKLRAFYDSVGL